MDIPQEISEKIASYIRRPYTDEDIIVIVDHKSSVLMHPGQDLGITLPWPLDMLILRMKRIGYKESVIQRHAQWARKKWAKGERKIYIY